MTTVPGASPLWAPKAAAITCAAVALLMVPIAAGVPIPFAAALAAAGTWLFAARSWIIRWQSLLTFLLLVIFFIPIRRYTLPTSLPFELEPYRMVVALLIGCWGTSILIDNRVRLRRSGFEGPLLLFMFAALVSVVLNGGRIARLGIDSNVFKSLSFSLSFVLVLYMVVSVARSRGVVDQLLGVIVVAGVAVAILSIWESRTGYNVFNHLRAPFLQPVFDRTEAPRGGHFRAYGPAEHPIALSALLAMLAPIAVYFAYVRRARRWWGAAVVLVAGSLATVSRTGILMVIVEAFVLLLLRPNHVRRLWPAVLPLIVAVHFALPGTLGTFKESFFPSGGLIAEQRGYNDSGRVGDWGPTLKEVGQEPLFGIGFGTRITTGPKTNSRILDDEWLATLLSTGVVGFAAWGWLFARVIRRLAARARTDISADGWLAAALAAALAGFGAGMWTYDAFSFVQVTLVFYVLLAIASSVLAREQQPRSGPARPASIVSGHPETRDRTAR